MQPSPKLPSVLGLDEDISRLRNLFASSFPVQDTDLLAVTAELASEGSPQRAAEEEDFDWSITLSNIRELTDGVKASEARAQAAEVRAEKAEAKTKEFEHWLRVLHKAVLEGLSQRMSSIK